LLSHTQSSSSFDHFGALFVKKLVAAIGAEKLDLLMAQLLRVAVKLALALRAGHPKNLRHGASSYQLVTSY
jgi:hypothetical protein